MTNFRRIHLVLVVFFLGLSISGGFSAQQNARWLELGSRVEASDIDPALYPQLADWLEKNGKSPLEYIIEKCKKHQLVIFGELHGIKDYTDLFLQIIPEAYHQAGMRYVILEAAKFEDNEKIATLIEGETFNRDLYLDIARGGAWGTWNYQEYWDALEVVWKLNRSLTAGAEHMKVIGMDVSADLQLNWLWQNGKLDDYALMAKAQRESLLLEKRDELMAAAIDLGVLRKGAKGMVWVGQNHSFTHYAQPLVNKDGVPYREFQRMAYQLYQVYGDRIFQIAFHVRHDSPKVVFDGYKGGEPVFSSVIEKIMAVRDSRPVGWDVFISPFAGFRDKQSYNFFFLPRARFADICRGFIFLKPWDKLSSCRRIKNFVTEEMFKKGKIYYETVYRRTFNSVKELNEFLERA